MKFVSKNINLRIVLKPGIQAEPLSGRSAIPGMYVKFQDGIANIEDEEYINLMLKHPGFNSDFVLVDNGIDPYANTREESEPQHFIQELEHGQVKKTIGEKKSPITPELKKLIQEQISEGIKSGLMEILKNSKDKMNEEKDGVDEIDDEVVEEAKDGVIEETSKEDTSDDLSFIGEDEDKPKKTTKKSGNSKK